MDRKLHWETTYTAKKSTQVGWYKPHLSISMDLVMRSGVGAEGRIIDVGGGASTLVDDLLDKGFKYITVLDISSSGLDISRSRLGKSADSVKWIEGDITEISLPDHYYDLWHDRAVFHFLTMVEDRLSYIQTARNAVKSGGSLIMGVFGPEAPPKCSGLDVVRYDPDSLKTELGKDFILLDSREEVHHTPSGTPQQYIYCSFRKA